jgi:hypothetical protein
MIGDETIMAYVDGELGPAEAAALEAEIARDADLARRVASHRALRAAAAGAFAGVLDEPVPDRLLAAALAEPEVARPRFGLTRRLALPAWAAMAASLVVGVMLGQGAAMLNRSLIATGAQGLEARGELASALDRNLAADPGAVRLGVSFRDTERSYCRSFVVERDALAGVACREGGRWAVRMTAEAKPGETGGYRMAASAMPPTVLSAIDTMMVGEPLDRAGEEAARASGWTKP